MGKIATSLNTLQSHNSDKLPSQTVLNPRNVSIITLRSCKQTEVPTPRIDVELEKEHDASKRNKSILEENEHTTRETHANQPSSISVLRFSLERELARLSENGSPGRISSQNEGNHGNSSFRVMILKWEEVSVELAKLPRTKPNTHQGNRVAEDAWFEAVGV
ncbi:hypothetical protein Lal_00013699 [Lupinus albus]|nr:hypothetical protein Lal_00013699 [Lupinus albus]